MLETSFREQEQPETASFLPPCRARVSASALLATDTPPAAPRKRMPSVSQTAVSGDPRRARWPLAVLDRIAVPDRS